MMIDKHDLNMNKLCKDCIHYEAFEVKASSGTIDHLCHVPEPDPILGGTRPMTLGCYVMRKSETEIACGPEGKYWEEKKV